MTRPGTQQSRFLGTFTVRPLDPAADAGLVHGWVTHPKAAFWLMGDAELADVEREYRSIAAHPHHDAFIGLHDGEPAFLIERYDPTEVELKGLYEAEPGDVGMHFLVAPHRHPGARLHPGRDHRRDGFLFADPSVRRVVVEPDVTNSAVQAPQQGRRVRGAPRDRQTGEGRSAQRLHA